jgi:cytochrome c biogenesis factor
MDSESVGDQPLTRPSQAKPPKARPRSASLDNRLFMIVAIMLLFTIVLLTINLVFQHRNYEAGISAAIRSNKIDHAVIISYTRAWDFAVAKVSSIFLAFCLIMVGALYVLRAATASYSLTMANLAQKSSLETGSPGLVMITLGVVLMAVVVLSTSKVEYQSGSDSPPIPTNTPPIPPDTATSEEQPKTQSKPNPKDDK